MDRQQLIVSVSGIRGIVGHGLTPQKVTTFAAALATFARGGKILQRMSGVKHIELPPCGSKHVSGEASCLRRCATVEQLLALRDTRPSPPPADLSPKEQEAIVHATLDKHYRGMLDEPIPMLGNVSPLTTGEAQMAFEIHRAPGPLARAYEYWVRRLAEREGRGKSDAMLRAAEAAARLPAPAKPTAAKTKSGAKKKSRGRKG